MSSVIRNSLGSNGSLGDGNGSSSELKLSTFKTSNDEIDNDTVDVVDAIVEIGGEPGPDSGSSATATFAKSKITAQGMMDIALITANANQLRYILEYQYDKRMYYQVLTLISLSLTLQIFVGICLILRGRRAFGRSPNETKQRSDVIIKNVVVCMVFLITIVNVFIACFTVVEENKQKI